MTDEDKALLIRGFRALDADHNGVVTKDEIVQYLRNTGLNRTQAKKQAKAMMDHMDPSNSGMISLKDYVRAKTLSVVQQQNNNDDTKMNMKGLSILDADKSGHIEKEKLEDILSRALPAQEKSQIMSAVSSENNSMRSKTGQAIAATSNSKMPDKIDILDIAAFASEDGVTPSTGGYTA